MAIPDATETTLVTSRETPGPERDDSGDRYVEFGEYCFDRLAVVLHHAGRPVPLAPQPSRILAALLAQPGELVTREELRRIGWPRTVTPVDLSLNTSIRHIRRALGDHATSPRFVETVPRRGYRFIVPVRAARPTPPTQRPPRGVRRLRRIGVSASLVLVASLAWCGVGPRPRIEILPVSVASDQASPGLGAALEELMRTAVVRSGGRRVAVLAPTAGSAHGAPAHYLVRSTLLDRAPGDILLTVQIVRSADRTVLWAGTFNPLCPDVRDPMAVIAGLVAEALLPRTG